MAIALGLLAAILYGSADFVGGFAAKRSTMFSVAVISQTAGFVVLIALLALPAFHAHARGFDYVVGAAGGVCGGLGITLLYRALAVGRMGVVSPITAVLAAAIPLVVGLARGEALNPFQIAGCVVALVAVVAISFSSEPDGRLEIRLEGVREAIVSGVFFGTFFVCLGYARHEAGLYPLLGARFVSIAFLTLLSFVFRQTLVPAKGSLATIVFAGVMDMTANALFVLATFAGYVSLASVLTSLYPATTVALAFIVLRERLSALQLAGAGLALVGVVLIAI